MNLGLSGRRAVVCGATKGIGRACAFELALQGAEVLALARDAAALAALCEELPVEPEHRHSYAVADFARPDDVGKAIDKAVAERGVAHILINNTGGPPGGPAIEASVDEYVAAFRTHLVCNQILAQALVPGMKEAGFGRIINIISTSVKEPIQGLGVSNTIRGAVASWAKTLARELGPFGITVNNVLPGFTDTERLRSLFEARAAKARRPVEEVAEEARKQVPTGRFARPEETAAAVAFLASPAAAYINGVNLPVDGGRLGCL